MNNNGMPLLPPAGGTSIVQEFECQDCGHFMRVRIIGGPVAHAAKYYTDDQIIAHLTSPAGKDAFNGYLHAFLQADKNTDYIIHTVRKGSISGHTAIKAVVTRKVPGNRAYTAHLWLTVSKGRTFGFAVLYFPGTFTGMSITRFNQMLTSFKML
ncbi:hypothetical protein GE278_06860 [Enterobacteriaceae bacterium Kacie_13]|nr:hypothetical protein GE278_06860 [Enterobacteriaceae bacterium Kacie_13]